MKNIGNILWGIVLVVIGLVLGINALGIANIDIFFDGWWTLFIIVPCFIGLFTDKDKTGDLIGIFIGVILLLGCQDIIAFEIIGKLLLPAILVIIGLSFIFKNAISSKVTSKIKEVNEKNNKKEKNEYVATFSGQKVDLTNETFNGCTINAIFGGVDLILTKANIKNDVVINATAIFGGVDIKVPENVNVKVNATSIFGGTSNKTENKEDNKVTIYINTTSLFGGVDIK